jgi:hypothetical protein
MVRRRFPSSGKARLVLYHPNFATVKKYHIEPQGKPRAELHEEYFCGIKISTQVLISLWKSTACAALTSHDSTLFSALHNLCATLFFHTSIFL